jgi:ferredoxin, 2Fe-2S
MSSQSDITITAFVNGQRYKLTTHKGEYRSVMALLYDQLYPEGFCECKGIGRCGTCHVRILNHSSNLLIKEGNEMSTMNKMGPVYDNSRLSCQMIIDKNLDGMLIEIVSDEVKAS